MKPISHALQQHFVWKGKLEIKSKVRVNTKEQLSVAYTPGVADACVAIQRDPSLSYQLTSRWNTVAVVTDGSAVLGLGDIGPEASMPVMEGKCVLFKEFADIDAIPLCIRSKDTKTVVDTVSLLAGSFGGINLEDISAPRCFEIERALKQRCDIPIFHDDQHGTAIVTLAALMNSLKVVKKAMGKIKVVVNGAGAAGVAITKLLVSRGVQNIILCDRSGAIYSGREGLNKEKEELAKVTNPEKVRGTLADALRQADVFIGVSAPGVVSAPMVRSMASDSILFPMANPVPEIMPEEALQSGAAIVGTGRSDFPNQINNVLAFPGVFRGALDVLASDINDSMKLAAAYALANIIPEHELRPDYILPPAFHPEVKNAVSSSVAKAAIESGVSRKPHES